MENIKPSAGSAPGVVTFEKQFPAAAKDNNASKTIDSVGPNVIESRKKIPVEDPVEKKGGKGLAKRKVVRHKKFSEVKNFDELMPFSVKTLRNMEFSYDFAGFTPKSMKDLEIMEHFREDVALFEEMVTNERKKVGRKSSDRTFAKENRELLRDQLFLLKQEYFALCHKRFKPVSKTVLDLHFVSSLRCGDEPDENQIERLANKYGQNISDLVQLFQSNALNGDRLSQHWQVFMSQSMEFLNVCDSMADLNSQIPIKPDGLLSKDVDMHNRYIDLISSVSDTVGLSLIKTLDDAVNHYPHLKEKADLNRGSASAVKGFSNWLNSASDKPDPDLFDCYEIPQVIQMISASLCIGEFATALRLLSKFINLIDGKIDGINAEMDDIEWLFYLASKALACLVCINLSDIDNQKLIHIETTKKSFKDAMEKFKQTFSLSKAECANLDDCFQRFIEGPCRDILLMHALKAEESAMQINSLISEEESEKARKKSEIRGKLKRKMTRGYGYRKPVQPKAPVPAAQSTARQDSPTPPRETPLPQGVQDAVKAFIADRPMAEVKAMIQSVVDDPESTPVVKAESYFALADMLDRKMNKEFDRIITHTSFIYSYGQLIRAGLTPSPTLGMEFKKAMQDVTDITKICGWLDNVNDALSTLSGLILRTDGLDREFLDELASLHERVGIEVGLVSEIEAAFDEIKSIWSERFQFLKRNNKLPKGRKKPVQDRQDQSQMDTFNLSQLQEAWGELKRQVNPLKMTLEKTGEDIDRHRISRLADCEQWEAGGDDDSSRAANDDPEVAAALVREEVQRAQLAGSCYGPECWSNFTLEDWLPGSALPDRHPLTLMAEALHRPLSVRAGGQQWLIREDGTATIKPGAIPKNSLNLTVDELADPLMPHNSSAL